MIAYVFSPRMILTGCVAMAWFASGPVLAAATDSSSDQSVSLEEIIVTAQKRSERLLDVPVPISVISGEQLESLQAHSLSDFVGYVPGLTVENGGSPGQNFLVIRGLGLNAGTGPLVATYIDDTPVSSSNALTRGAGFGFDLMPYDIEQIEVLKGPQGTLYGADAMGGLVKYSLRKPDLTQFDAQVGGDVESIDGSGGPSSGGRASVNLPIITNTLGVRASGFYQHTAGYIDNVGTGISGANHSNESGGRLTALWKPTDSLSIQATVLAQDIDAADAAGVTLDAATLRPVYGPNKYTSTFPQPFIQQARNYSLSVNWDVNFATLTSSTSWSHLTSEDNIDFTPYCTAAIFPCVGNLADFIFTDRVAKFTEEFRLTSPEHQKLQWMLGGFFTKEDGSEEDTLPVYTPDHVPLPANNLLISTFEAYLKERAVFGNAVYTVTDRVDIGAGARYAQNSEIDCYPVYSGPLSGGAPVPCSQRPFVGVATWSADARFHLDADSMFYLRWATGYRPGGCNNACVPSIPLELPGSFGPDKLANYEAGFKGEFLDHRLRLDFSLFDIDWRHIQLSVLNSLGLYYTGNGGTANSHGFEATSSYQITDRLIVQATLDRTDAHLTQDAPGIGGKNGDQLPGSPRWSGSLTGEYRQPIGERRQYVLGGGYRYRDTVNNQLAGTGEPLPIVPQNIADLYTGLVVNQVSMRLYAKNLFNNRSYTGFLYLADPQRPSFVPIQPRTIGFSLDYQFK